MVSVSSQGHHQFAVAVDARVGQGAAALELCQAAVDTLQGYSAPRINVMDLILDAVDAIA